MPAADRINDHPVHFSKTSFTCVFDRRAKVGLVDMTILSAGVPEPSDEEFAYLGLSAQQISLLDGQPNYVRQVVKEVALKRLMGIPHFADHFLEVSPS